MTEAVTPSEKYLGELCKSSFLSLWSYPNPYNDKGITETNKQGKELCDLLVVFENHVIIFSDKSCNFTDSGDLSVDWARWYKRAIDNSAKQIYGAERWIIEHPNRIFKDKSCTDPFPLSFPKSSEVKFHRVVIALGASQRIEEHYKGNSRGSLLLVPAIEGKQHLSPPKPYTPFQVGKINPNKGFVHVFDDITLDVVMRELDTVSDFVTYLQRKEEFLSLEEHIFVMGEEELLGFYLQNLDEEGHPSFNLPDDRPENTGIMIPEGLWDDYLKSPYASFRNDLKKAGTFVDSLIEHFSDYVLKNELAYGNELGIKTHEQNLRFLAAEPRHQRAAISEAIKMKMVSTPSNVRTSRVFPSSRDDVLYVFVLLPKSVGQTQHNYRLERQALLKLYAVVVKHKYPEIRYVVCIGTEPGMNKKGRSEDLISFDFDDWTEEDDANAKFIMEEHDILNDYDIGSVLFPPKVRRRYAGGEGNRKERRKRQSLKRKSGHK